MGHAANGFRDVNVAGLGPAFGGRDQRHVYTRPLDLSHVGFVSRAHWRNVPPSTNSVTRYWRSSNSPASCTVTICGWFSEEAVWASCWKRRRAALSLISADRNLM